MTDDLERRLREAFEAKAANITPPMMDVDREREFADELAETGRGTRRWMVGGLSTAAAVAAAVGIGVVVSNQHPPTREPVVAASTHRSSTPTTSSTSPTTPSSAPRQTQQAPPQVEQPPQTTQAPPPLIAPTSTKAPTPPSTSEPSSSKKMASEPPKMSQTSSPTTTPTSAPASSDVGGNYYLHGDLRKAAGVAYLPLPASTPTYIQDETGRTTRLSTNDCAAILRYWDTAMPAGGWKRAPSASKDRWFAPTGDAWAFTDATSGACTIQISAGP